MMDREAKVIHVQTVKAKSVVQKRYLASTRSILMVEFEVLPHEGFCDGDIVTVTVEKKRLDP